MCGIALGSGSNAQVLYDPASFLRHISAAGDTRRKNTVFLFIIARFHDIVKQFS
ncbi:hypothetical protein RUMCAL_01267 [Ruminococcus callidus ATCC 27760]|uniref:Uncharacterized protein n=1 Tax=Ruminococcus callidus ATCC 27760 TaxID=411473 RepID=U2KCV9_9FIRM|nr:hypothetical protein RUMCAL_01267 [Ruminococcus callidus ATCC 27760]